MRHEAFGMRHETVNTGLCLVPAALRKREPALRLRIVFCDFEQGDGQQIQKFGLWQIPSNKQMLVSVTKQYKSMHDYD